MRPACPWRCLVVWLCCCREPLFAHLAHRHGADVAGDVEAGVKTKYDLVANICHDSFTETGKAVAAAAGEDPLRTGSYRVHVKNDCTGQVTAAHVDMPPFPLPRSRHACLSMCHALQWYEMQDLHVQETLPQLIGLSESYLMVYRQQE